MRSCVRGIFRWLDVVDVVDDRGSEIVEAAATLPLMFMILIGIFWFGQAFSTYGTITRAAQEGARAAVAPVCSTCAPVGTQAGNAYTAIQNILVTSKLDPTKLQAPSTIPSLLSCTTNVPVSCDPSQTTICVQSSVLLSNEVTGTGLCGTSVTFQYPYQFWLPFTSLNKQLITLNAAARVRLETH
jgi:Flp pilus assembly protein TadG